jgi:hypothetical protein
MSISKKDIGGSVVWTNDDVVADYISNPGNGSGVPEIEPANIDFGGCEFSVSQTDNATGNPVQIVKCIPGNLAFEGCELVSSGSSWSVVNIPGDLAFTGETLVPGHTVVNTPGDLAFEGVTLTPGHGVINSPGNIDFEGIEQRPMFYVPSTIQKKKFYTCTLTGAADGTTDVVLPVSSISIRLRNGEPTYCGVVVPNVGNNETYINDRLNGQLVIYRGFEYTDGGQSVAEICRVDLEATPYDQGVRKSSFQLSGHITVSNGAPSTFDIRPIQTMSVQSDGARRVRSQPQFFLRSGDTVIYGDAGESFTAGLITISVDTNLDRMEVTEYSP